MKKKKSVSQSVSQSVGQSVSQSVNQLSKKSSKEIVSQLAGQLPASSQQVGGSARTKQAVSYQSVTQSDLGLRPNTKNLFDFENLTSEIYGILRMIESAAAP